MNIYLYWKQVNASLNSTPQGPVAIPPRQGHSQLMSPLGKTRPGASSSSSGKLMVDGFIKSSGVIKTILSFPEIINKGKREIFVSNVILPALCNQRG